VLSLHRNEWTLSMKEVLLLNEPSESHPSISSIDHSTFASHFNLLINKIGGLRFSHLELSF
jgi:hypothetical protein